MKRVKKLVCVKTAFMRGVLNLQLLHEYATKGYDTGVI